VVRVLASSNFLVPNGTFVVEVVAFLLVLGALAKWVLPPLDRAIAKRQAEIRQGLDDAERGRELLREAEAERTRILEEARREARATIEQAARVGEQLREELVQRGREEAERIVARAEAEVERAAQRAAEELRQQLADLVTATAERVLARELDSEAHRALVEETIAAVESRV
jgi:F-type H+-transporting ATPase subunit b